MAYEKRETQRYYYQKKWVNGKCVSVYLGKGPEAEAAHARRQKEINDRKNHEEKKAISEEVARCSRHAGRLLTMYMVAQGYHRPNRSWWRKRNRRTMTEVRKEAQKRHTRAMDEINDKLRAARPAEPEYMLNGISIGYHRYLAANSKRPRRKSMLLVQLAALAPRPVHTDDDQLEPFTNRTNYVANHAPSTSPQTCHTP